MSDFEQYLKRSAVTKEVIDSFLDPSRPHWAQFDSELGYILGNDMPRDGLDGCLTISTVGSHGARRSVHYSDFPCRINTYGDSFTQCHQVSDYETWQEILATHFGEPVRNFGMGGYGLYQAYRRLVRTELSPAGAEYLILYIWGDDHMRSLLRCRHALTYPWWNSLNGRLFHGNFWAHLEMDLELGKLIEKPNLLSTPESLYQMTDPDFMADSLQDDLMLQICAYIDGFIQQIDWDRLNRLAEILGHPAISTGDPVQGRKSVSGLRNAYAFTTTKYILDRVTEFAAQHEKKVMIVIFDPHVTRELITTGSRSDLEIVQDLENRGIPYFDMNLIHVNDYKCFQLSLDDYFKRYFIGHYNPSGNHFFAFAIKQKLVEWLDPKPPTYQDNPQSVVGFKGYLSR